MGESFSWQQGSIEKSIPRKGRDLEAHEAMLNFPLETLEGKVVLDLGSALGAKFAKDMQMAGIKAEVISVSPDFSEGKYRQLVEPTTLEKAKATIRLKKIEKPLAVAALGEQLPFKDESFDEIIALYSVSRYSKDHEQWIKESCRVLKEGGELRAGPFPFSKFNQGSGEDDSVTRLMSFLDGLGFEYEFTDTPGFEKTRTGEDDSQLSLLILKKQKRKEISSVGTNNP